MNIIKKFFSKSLKNKQNEKKLVNIDSELMKYSGFSKMIEQDEKQRDLDKNKDKYYLIKCGNCEGSPIFCYREGYYLYCVDCNISTPYLKTDTIAVNIWNKLSMFYKYEYNYKLSDFYKDHISTTKKIKCVCEEGNGSIFYTNLNDVDDLPKYSPYCSYCNFHSVTENNHEEVVYSWVKSIKFLKKIINKGEIIVI